MWDLLNGHNNFFPGFASTFSLRHMMNEENSSRMPSRIVDVT